MMDVLIDVTHAHDELDVRDVEELALFVMYELNLPSTSEVSLSFVDDDRIAELNEAYRGKVGPTDVLSFECDNLDDDFPEGETYSLGDIVIACDVASAQANDIGWSFIEEIELLVVHGLLHLCGYDHIEDADAAVMESKQRALLARWHDEREHESSLS